MGIRSGRFVVSWMKAILWNGGAEASLKQTKDPVVVEEMQDGKIEDASKDSKGKAKKHQCVRDVGSKQGTF